MYIRKFKFADLILEFRMCDINLSIWDKSLFFYRITQIYSQKSRCSVSERTLGTFPFSESANGFASRNLYHRYGNTNVEQFSGDRYTWRAILVNYTLLSVLSWRSCGATPTHCKIAVAASKFGQRQIERRPVTEEDKRTHLPEGGVSA